MRQSDGAKGATVEQSGAPDCLKLTGYFDERQRSTGDRFLADVLLDLFEQRRIAASVLLRGAGGFGPQRILRSDRSLTLSEDPPVVVTAVDTAAAIENLLDPLQQIPRRGLFTLERARLLTAATAVPRIGETGAAKLTVYVGRKHRVNGVPAYIAVCELMRRRGLAGASVFLGVDGTAHGTRRRAGFFGGNADVPVLIVVVGAAPAVTAVVGELSGLLDSPLITLERVRICRRDGVALDGPDTAPGVDEHGRPLFQKLTVYTSAAASHGGEPIHRGLLRRLHAQRSARGATVLRGIWGFHGDHAPHGDRLFALARRVPVATVIIDTPTQIEKSFPVIEELTAATGLVTSELVPALVATDGAGAKMTH